MLATRLDNTNISPSLRAKLLDSLPVLIVTLVVAEGLFDPITPRGISDWMFFIIPIILTGWTEKKMTIPVTTAACILTIVGWILSPAPKPISQNSFIYSIINRGIGITVFWITAALVMFMRSTLIKLKRAHVTVEEQAKKLLEAERLKIQFLADSSHELRTPLAVARSWVDLALHKKSKNHTDPLRALKQVNAEIKHMSHVIANLTMLTKSDTTPYWELTLTTFSLDALISEIIKKYRVLAPKTEITTNFSSQVMYTGDREKLKKLFANLLTNAVRYGKQNGRIMITITRDQGTESNPFIRVAIKDDGIGIPAKDLPYIFERFYRVRATSEGVGLGLAICKSIAEAHGGSVGALSKYGEGSTFTVALPLQVPNRAQ